MDRSGQRGQDPYQHCCCYWCRCCCRIAERQARRGWGDLRVAVCVDSLFQIINVNLCVRLVDISCWGVVVPLLTIVAAWFNLSVIHLLLPLHHLSRIAVVVWTWKMVKYENRFSYQYLGHPQCTQFSVINKENIKWALFIAENNYDIFYTCHLHHLSTGKCKGKILNNIIC
jgi:hypothetical protein